MQLFGRSGSRCLLVGKHADGEQWALYTSVIGRLKLEIVIIVGETVCSLVRQLLLE